MSAPTLISTTPTASRSMSILLWISGIILLGLVWPVWQMLSVVNPLVADLAIHPPDIPINPFEYQPQIGLTYAMGGIFLLTGLLNLALGWWFTTPRLPAARRFLAFLTWVVRLSAALAFLSFLFALATTKGMELGPYQEMLPGTFQISWIGLSLMVLLPLVVVTWLLMDRLNRWVQDASHWQQTDANRKQLQRRNQLLRYAIFTAQAPLAFVFLAMLGIQITGRAESMAIQTPLQIALDKQQATIISLCLIASAVGVVALQVTRSAARDLTHELDPQHSRIGSMLQQR